MKPRLRTPSRSLVACAALTALLSLASRDAEAQESPTVTEGQRIRLTSTDRPHGRYEAELVAVEADAIRVRRRSFATNAWSTDTVPLASITSVQVARGRESNVGKGALIGTLAGGGLGLLGGIALAADDSGWFDYDAGDIPLAVLGGGLWGAGIGAIVGLITPGTRWADVPVSSLRIEAGPGAAGLIIALPVRP